MSTAERREPTELVVGIDVGGTFTDGVAIDLASGRTYTAKAPTTPRDQTEGVLEVLQLLAAQVGLTPAALLARTTKFAHGTTLSSNIVFTWSGARTGLIATRGFGDQILIMRAIGRVAGRSLSERRHFRAMDKPPQIVPRQRIREISERIDRSGNVLVAPDPVEVEQAVRELLAEGVEAIAVGLLWSFKQPAHEQLVGEAVHRLSPQTYVSLSNEIAPVLGEYERTATAVVNCYVGPLIRRYLERLEQRLKELGLARPPLILQASGGAAPVDRTVPVHTIESGPAAGVVSAKLLADTLGLPNVIATDVGGTTFKVSLIANGAWGVAREAVVNQYSLAIPMLDVVSIGAGGGSVARVEGGRLLVGPQSAGADPGPACYGRGGDEPTVTDADLVLGFINPDYFLGGRIRLDHAAAERAIRDRVADPLFGGDVLQAAAGIRAVVDAQMGDLVRKATIERGHDPRDFVLLAYGGAGPLHAASYGRDVGVARLLVPLTATVFSAFGAAAADVLHSFSTSSPLLLPGDPSELEARFGALEARARVLLRQEGVGVEAIELARWAEIRYRRQVHQVRVPLASRPLEAAGLRALMEDFEHRYEALYGRGTAYREAGLELVSVGLDATGRTSRPPLVPQPANANPPDADLKGSRPVYWVEHGALLPTIVYAGERLIPGQRLSGPALIELPGTSVAIPPSDRAEVDPYRNLVIELGGGDG